MISGVVLVSQAYLNYASQEILEEVAAQVRLTLVVDEGEDVHSGLAPFLDEVHRLKGQTHNSLLPSFDVGELASVVRKEIELAGGDPRSITLFCQHERNVLPTAQVRKVLGIAGDGPDVMRRFKDKLAMKEALSKSMPEALPRHQLLSFERLDEDPVGYYRELVTALGTEKLVVKPTGASGSFNVAIIDTADGLRSVGERTRRHEREFDYEVDEFLQGTMYQCDSYVREGVVLFSGILELGCSNFDFLSGSPLTVYPVSDERDYRQLFEFNQAVVTTLGFANGSTHHEIYVQRRPSGELLIKFGEIGARVPGGLGVPYHQLNSGVNLMDANLLLAVGREPAPSPADAKPKNNVVSALLPVGNGEIVSLNEPDVASAFSIDWRVGVGERVDCHTLVDVAGILTLVNDDKAELRRDFESLQSYRAVTCA
jgi:hypothetical protein